MSREKILAFLDFDIKKPVDKFFLKLFTWFNFSFGIWVLIVLLLLAMPFTQSVPNWSAFLFIGYTLVSNTIFFITINRIKKVVYEWIYYVIIVSSSVLTLLYGWYISSEYDHVVDGYAKFGWLHLLAFSLAVGISYNVVSKMVHAYLLLRDHTIDEVKAYLSLRKSPLIPIVVSVSPIMLVRVLRGPFQRMDMGMGLPLWCLMCIWLIFLFLISPKVFIILKYKVYKWLD